MGILGTLISRRSESGSSTLAKPAPWLVNMFGGGTTRAGVVINERTALSLSTVWACVRAISEDVAKLPFRVYERNEDDSRNPLPTDPVTKLLSRRPNPEMTAIVMRETITAHMLLWGNGFIEIERNNAGFPIALWPLRPDRMEVARDNQGTVYYRYRDEMGKAHPVDATDIMHLRGLGFDGLLGYSIVRMARESMGLSAAAETFGGSFFGNAARPAGIVTYPGTQNDKTEKNLGASFKRLYSGAENAGNTIILNDAVKWQQITMPPEDAQFLETRQFQVTEICRWFRVPPHKVANLDKATFSNIEHQSLEYVQDTLTGWMTRWEQEAGAKLFPPDSNKYAEHVTAGLLRADLKARYDAYSIGRQWGWLSADDVRRRENENPLPDGQGEMYLVPLNMADAAAIHDGANVDPAPKDPTKDAPADPPADVPADPAAQRGAFDPDVSCAVRIQRPVFHDGVRRLLRLEADKARRAAKQDQLPAWAEKFYGPEHVDHIRSVLFPAVEALSSTLRGLQVPVSSGPWVGDFAKQLAEWHITRSRHDLKSHGAKAADAWETDAEAENRTELWVEWMISHLRTMLADEKRAI